MRRPRRPSRPTRRERRRSSSVTPRGLKSRTGTDTRRPSAVTAMATALRCRPRNRSTRSDSSCPRQRGSAECKGQRCRDATTPRVPLRLRRRAGGAPAEIRPVLPRSRDHLRDRRDHPRSPRPIRDRRDRSATTSAIAATDRIQPPASSQSAPPLDAARPLPNQVTAIGQTDRVDASAPTTIGSGDRRPRGSSTATTSWSSACTFVVGCRITRR